MYLITLIIRNEATEYPFLANRQQRTILYRDLYDRSE